MFNNKIFPLSRVVLVAVALVGLASYPASAQSDYPSRPIRIIVPTSAGGGTDTTARVIADHISKPLGQQVIIENRPGATGLIGYEAAARSTPDGYTLLMGASTLAVNPAIFKQLRYDAVKDFAPITQVAGIANVLVAHPSLNISTVPELIALAKQKPDELNYASAGAASSPHMSMELLKNMADLKIQHIPFPGTAPAMREVLAGRVPLLFSNILTAKQHIEAGSLRALAVSSAKRVDALPTVPTVAESGLAGYEAMQWYALLAPAGTPPAIVTRLNAEVIKALASPEVKERLRTDGAEPIGNTPAEFAAQLNAEIEKWATVARLANIKMD